LLLVGDAVQSAWMSAVVTFLDCVLRGIGALACPFIVIAVTKVGVAFRSSCDSRTARATLSPTAFAGKVVWITGASSGIGKELAVQLARQGARLILSARRADALEDVVKELAQSLAQSGGEARALPLDLADLDALPGKADAAIAMFGGVDVLVNNGGYSSRALAQDTEGIKEEDAMMKVNFLSYVALAKAVAPSMRARKGGHIINVSSIAGKVGVPLRTMYCAAKHAVIGWFDAFRAEEAGFFRSGIAVTNVCPGSVKTDVARNAVTADGSRLGHSDPNIESGLEVSFVCDRILAAAAAGLDEVWIGKAKELSVLYRNSLFPDEVKVFFRENAKGIVERTMGAEFARSRL